MTAQDSLKGKLSQNVDENLGFGWLDRALDTTEGRHTKPTFANLIVDSEQFALAPKTGAAAVS